MNEKKKEKEYADAFNHLFRFKIKIIIKLIQLFFFLIY